MNEKYSTTWPPETDTSLSPLVVPFFTTYSNTLQEALQLVAYLILHVAKKKV